MPIYGTFLTWHRGLGVHALVRARQRHRRRPVERSRGACSSAWVIRPSHRSVGHASSSPARASTTARPETFEPDVREVDRKTHRRRSGSRGPSSPPGPRMRARQRLARPRPIGFAEGLAARTLRGGSSLGHPRGLLDGDKHLEWDSVYDRYQGPDQRSVPGRLLRLNTGWVANRDGSDWR
jgi:hypothetical protein